MSATKARASIWAAQTLTAGAGNTTSTAQDLSSTYGSEVSIQLTNGATGPTVPAQVQIQVANDVAGTLFVNFGGPLVGSTSNNGVSSWSVYIPFPVNRLRLVAGSNTVHDVTVDADISSVTAQ